MTQVYPLIKIKAPHSLSGFILIAAHEFNAETHKLWDDAVSTLAPPPATNVIPPANDAVDFSKMTVPQMKAFAAENQIDLGGAQSKADVSKALEAWKVAKFGEPPATPPAAEDEGEDAEIPE